MGLMKGGVLHVDCWREKHTDVSNTQLAGGGERVWAEFQFSSVESR